MSGILVRSVKLEVRTLEGSLSTKILEVENADRVRRFAISTDDVDRYGDVLIQKGINITHYRNNPSVLLNHNPDLLTYGRAAAMQVGDTETLMDVEFLPEGMDEDVDKVFERYKAGFMWSGSVGFLPEKIVRRTQDSDNELFKEYPAAERIFTNWELLEFSVVTIPANPMALAKSLSDRYLGAGDKDFTKDGNTPPAAPAPDFDEDAVLKAVNRYRDSLA